MLVRLIPTALPIAELPSLDLRMLAGAVALTVATGLAFGLLPALRVCRRTDGSALKDGARGGTSRTTERLRTSLVVAEIVAAMVLLVTVGLLTQALLRVQDVYPGFSTDNVVTLRTTLPRPKYQRAVTRAAFYDRVLADVKALPGVQSAAYISFLPMVMRGGVWEVLSTVPDPTRSQRFAPEDPGQERRASFRYLTPGFFATIRTPIVRGRDVSDTDTPATPDVAVVSESFVNQYFADRDPIGQQFAIAFKVRTIVGVVGDIRVRGLERESEPQVYVANSQFTDGQPGFYVPQDLAIRSSLAPASLVPAVRRIIGAADPQLPITNIRTLGDVVSAETEPRTVQVRVLGAFAIAAFLLAAIGIHGLLAFTVRARAREIGVRITLGAKARDIIGMVMGRSAVMAAAGVVIGAAVAYAAGRSMQALLFGVEPANPMVFIGAIALAAVMTMAGSILPAWRAVRVDPLTITRAE
jgi:putative ABC transport system permease protein